MYRCVGAKDSSLIHESCEFDITTSFINDTNFKVHGLVSGCLRDSFDDTNVLKIKDTWFFLWVMWVGGSCPVCGSDHGLLRTRASRTM